MAGMKAGQYGPIEVFRAGTFNPVEGETMTIREQDLRDIADSYDADQYPAPVVIGHPKIDAPAFGWVDQLYVEGGILKATIKDAVSEFAEQVKQGRYRKVSISLFLPKSSANPKPGTFYLRHIGFLGAAAPAVPGLKPVHFAGGSAGSIAMQQDMQAGGTASFGGDNEELHRLRREVKARKVEALIDAGKVLPVFKEEILTFAASLDDRETVSFSDGSEATRNDWFFGYLERQPKVVSFGAMNLGREAFSKERRPTAPSGYTVDTSQDALYNRARQIEREQDISFVDAVALAEGEM